MTIDQALAEFDEADIYAEHLFNKFKVLNMEKTKVFIRQALEARDQEWLGCLPGERVFGEWNNCRELFLTNAKKKGLVCK